MDKQRETSTKALADLLAVAAAHGVLAPDIGPADLVRSGFVPREDTPEEEAEPEVFVDCAARMPICQAVCCKLAIHLSADEVTGGTLRWDTQTPFLLQREDDGRCTHQDRETRVLWRLRRPAQAMPPLQLCGRPADLARLRGDGSQPGVDRRQPGRLRRLAVDPAGAASPLSRGVSCAP